MIVLRQRRTGGKDGDGGDERKRAFHLTSLVELEPDRIALPC